MAQTSAPRNFTPSQTCTLTVSETSTRGLLGVGRKDVMLYNTGTTAVFVKFGDSAVVATDSDTPIPPSACMVLHAGDHSHIAALASETVTLYATSGFGI